VGSILFYVFDLTALTPSQAQSDRIFQNIIYACYLKTPNQCDAVLFKAVLLGR